MLTVTQSRYLLRAWRLRRQLTNAALQQRLGLTKAQLEHHLLHLLRVRKAAGVRK